MKIMDPFEDGRGEWVGDSPGTLRKRFYCFEAERPKDFRCNVTLYAPGEGSVFHNHPDSEELGFVIRGAGILQDMEQNTTAEIRTGDLFLVARGEFHRVMNNGDIPLSILLVCRAGARMPEG